MGRDDAECALRAETSDRADPGDDAPERAVVEGERAARADLRDDVRRQRALRRSGFDPDPAFRGTVDYGTTDRGRGREGSCQACGAYEGGQGKERPTHEIWIGPVFRSG
jgi:hypothetical protein